MRITNIDGILCSIFCGILFSICNYLQFLLSIIRLFDFWMIPRSVTPAPCGTSCCCDTHTHTHTHAHSHTHMCVRTRSFLQLTRLAGRQMKDDGADDNRRCERGVGGDLRLGQRRNQIWCESTEHPAPRSLLQHYSHLACTQAG